MELLVALLCGTAGACLAAAVARSALRGRLRVLRALKQAIAVASGRVDPEAVEEPAAPGRRPRGQGIASLLRAVLARFGRVQRAPLRRWAEGQLRGTGLPLRPEEFVGLCALGVVVGGLLGLALPLPAALRALLFLAAAVAAPVGARMARGRRSVRICLQLGESLMTLSNGMRAGHSLLQAIAAAADQTGPPLGEEYARLLRETSAGIPMEEALARLVERTASADVELLVTAILVQREVGGNLAEILDRIATTIRARVAVQNHLRVVTAQSRMSGWVVGLLPIGLFVLISVIAPGIESVLVHTLMGRILGLGAILMEGAGLLVIRGIVSIRY